MSKHTKYLKCILYINHLETSQQLILQDVGSTMNMMNKNEKKKKIYIGKRLLFLHEQTDGIFELFFII